MGSFLLKKQSKKTMSNIRQHRYKSQTKLHLLKMQNSIILHKNNKLPKITSPKEKANSKITIKISNITQRLISLKNEKKKSHQFLH